jgi:hypothetical protein
MRHEFGQSSCLPSLKTLACKNFAKGLNPEARQ